MHPVPFHRQPVTIAAAVVLLHVGGLAALQSGLLVRAYEVIVPVEMVSQIIEPPKPEIAPPPPPAPPVPPPPSAEPPKQITLPPAPQPLTINDPAPAPNAPVAVPSPAAPLPPISSPVAPSLVPPAPVTPPTAAPPIKVEEPVVEADYNADTSRFKRHRLSEQFGEHGVVTVKVLVGADGVVKNAHVAKSSGFPRLDETALRGAKLTRFKPATRNGIPIEREYPLRVIYEEIK